MAEKQTITVTVEGGVVQWIGGVPEGVIVVVHDYDVDGVESERLKKDETGDKYVECVWEHEE